MFMDVVMSEMNGDVALKTIRKKGYDVPVLMLSSVTDQALVTQCETNGVSGFIFKPIQADNGAEIIKSYLKVV